MDNYQKIHLGHTFWGNYDHGTIFLRLNSFEIRNFSELFFGTIYVIILLWMLILKLGIRKHIAVSVNKKSVNKSMSKIVFDRY